MVGMSSRSLAGQVAVITWASRGIGLQVALHLSALGAEDISGRAADRTANRGHTVLRCR